MVGGAGMTFAVRPIGVAMKRWLYLGASAISNTPVAFPMTPSAGDLAVLVGAAPSGASTPAGWTPMASGVPFHFFRVCSGGESSVSLSVSGNYLLMLFRPQGGSAYWDAGVTTTTAGLTTMTAPNAPSLLIAAPSVNVPGAYSWSYTLPTANNGNIDAVGSHMVLAATTTQQQFAAVAANIAPGASTGGMDVQYDTFVHRRTYGIFGIA